MHILAWEGISYQAGPPELACIPKVVGYLRTRPTLKDLGPMERKHLDDLRYISKVVDWPFLQKLLDEGGLRWLGRRLPTSLRSHADPFVSKEILALQGMPAVVRCFERATRMVGSNGMTQAVHHMIENPVVDGAPGGESLQR